MPTLTLQSFLFGTLDYLDAHPGAQFALFCCGVLLAIRCAWIVRDEDRKRIARERLRERLFAETAASYQRSVVRQIRSGHDGPKEAA